MGNTEGIIKVIEEYYEDLYGEKSVDERVIAQILEYIDKTVEPSDTLGQAFTAADLRQCLKSFKTGKSPGLDGLPIEFYLTFWDILAADLLSVFTEFSELDKMPESFRTCLVTLIHKGKDKTVLENWRPITLLNCDCKLFSKLLAVRIRPVLSQIIHQDQACAVKGRKIADSLVLIRDTICFARDRNKRLIVLNLDFEKSFDRISHRYLFKDLQKMGFPERLISWVKLLYKEIESRFVMNGSLMSAVKVNCGVRQGCPLSALLYVICKEPLAQRTFEVTDWFGRASASQLNRGKTQAQFYGQWGTTELTGLETDVIQTDQKILGVRFDKNGGGKANWPRITGKVKQRLVFWGLRTLTFRGKF